MGPPGYAPGSLALQASAVTRSAGCPGISGAGLEPAFSGSGPDVLPVRRPRSGPDGTRTRFPHRDRMVSRLLRPPGPSGRTGCRPPPQGFGDPADRWISVPARGPDRPVGPAPLLFWIIAAGRCERPSAPHVDLVLAPGCQKTTSPVRLPEGNLTGLVVELRLTRGPSGSLPPFC